MLPPSIIRFETGLLPKNIYLPVTAIGLLLEVLMSTLP
jgi:hypothetical protein